MCIASVGELILVGTQTGNLWVYHAREEKLLHAMPSLPDAVLCLRQVQNQVFAGLANGELAMYNVDEFQNPPISTRTVRADKSVCCPFTPILCLAVAKKKLFCGAGHSVVAFKLDSCLNANSEEHNWNVSDQWSVSSQSEPHHGLVSNIVIDRQGVWTATKGSSRIQLWDFKTHKLHAFVSCEDIIRASEPCEDQSARGMRVVSLLIHRNVLWVGIGCGRILLIDARSMAPLMMMNRHKSAVRVLAKAEINDGGKPMSVVLSGGLGFVQRQCASRELSSRDFGYILVWESGINEQSNELHDYKQKRQEWLLNHINNK